MDSTVKNQPQPAINHYPPARVWTKTHPFITRINHWLYNQTTTRKIVDVGPYVIGAAAMIGATFVSTIPTAVALIVGGTLYAGITLVAIRAFNCYFPIRHDMKDLAFHPDKLQKNGKLLGELSYDGLVPVLKINVSDPKEAGYTQGYLLHQAIAALRSSAEFCIFTLARQKRPSEFTKVLNDIKSKIPKRFLLELEGLVEGYNAKKGRFEKALSLNDLLYLQLMPDSMYFKPENFKEVPQPQNATKRAMACTLLALSNQNGAPLIARTMDWTSFGVAGKFSLIISRFNEATGIRTAEVGIPGMVGSFTGVNSKGVSMAMNVVDYPGKLNTVEGMPATFYNRMILEESSSFDEAEKIIQSNRALGPYHLTVSDSTKSGTFSLYQNEDWTNDWSKDKKNGYRLRLLSKDDPLITTNCSCTPNERDMFYGKEREKLIKKYLTDNQKIKDTEQILKHSQSIPYVNNSETTHRVLMGHQTLEVAFDNAWAGDRNLHSVNLKKIFSV